MENMNEVISNKIDFAVVFAAKNCNPNGDPVNGGRPRTAFRGLDEVGEVSDVCLKRKVRNRLIDMGENVFVQSDDKNVDGCKSLSERLKSAEDIKAAETDDEKKAIACKKWIDVRSFGQLFAFKKGADSDSISIGVRGPVTIQPAFSVDPVNVTDTQITKSVNSETKSNGGLSSDRIGNKSTVDFGLYVTKGSINCLLAEKTGFTNSDVEKIKEALKTLFMNDEAAARPAGTMEVIKVYWWTHDCKDGRASSVKVFRTLHVTKKADVDVPVSADDYEMTVDTAPDGITCEEIDCE